MTQVERLLLENQIVIIEALSVSLAQSERVDDLEIARLLQKVSDSTREFIKYNTLSTRADLS